MANHLGAGAAGGNLPRPARNKWDAMASFPEIIFYPAQRTNARMVVLLNPLIGELVRSVIGGKDDQRVGRRPAGLKTIQDLSDGPVQLLHVIAVKPRLAGSLKAAGRYDWLVGPREG
jgi:hypothetical protein